MKKKKILVTGASGYLGSYLMKLFDDGKHEVKGIVKKIDQNNDSRLIEADLSYPIEFDYCPDCIVHAVVCKPEKGNDIYDYIRGNVDTTRNIIDYALKKRSSILAFGAMSSYGNAIGELTEESDHIEPDDYGITKLISERMIRESNVPNRILVLPGVLGNGSVRCWLARTILKIKNGENVTVYNPDGLFNNAVHIEDVGRFILHLLVDNMVGTDTYLLSSEDVIKVRNLIDSIKELVSSDSDIDYLDNHRGYYINSKKAFMAGFKSRALIEMIEELL